MKERLRQINPAFVWENVDKYPNLEARTVTVDTAISRLKNIGGVKFTDNDEKNLRSLRTTRNAIEHYEWSTTEKEAKSLSAMLSVSRFPSLPSISAPISRLTSSKTILGDHSLRSCLTSFALMARESKRISERKANIRPTAMLASSSPSPRGAAVASFAVIGKMSMMVLLTAEPIH